MEHRKKRKAGKALRVLALCLSLIIMCASLASCKARRLHPTDDALAEVGSVTFTASDGRSVTYHIPYEELYFLAVSYAPSVEKKHPRGSEEFNKALMEEITGNITANYAMLALCFEMGLEYDETELRADVKTGVENTIDNSFGGSRKNYLNSIKEMGMTDHYFRFLAGVDHLYAQLPLIYAQKELVPNNADEIREYIEENYICVKHIAIFNNANDSDSDNLALANRVADLLKGGTSINDLIGGKPINANEDLLIPYDGYYFGKGVMDKAYEDAAFALEIGETSEPVKTRGENSNGEYTDCYYVIQRQPLDKDYVDTHLTSLGDGIAQSIIATKYDTLKESLVFRPSELCNSLNMSELEAPGAGVDTALIIVLASAAGLAIAAALGVFFYIRHRNKKIATARRLKEGKA